jgi:hypothetical protein
MRIEQGNGDAESAGVSGTAMVPDGVGRRSWTSVCRRLNQVLEKAGFDPHCEEQCCEHYHQKLGRPSLAPGV